jgi:2-polyprenyl-6-methoxyphenol hydroxylase-like FAD-dependent oxidoreductase
MATIDATPAPIQILRLPWLAISRILPAGRPVQSGKIWPMLDVGIVGGSIAGCFTALELLDAGHRVTIFERSETELHGLLGAGLGTPTPMFRTLVERDLVDEDIPHLNLTEMAFVSLDGSSRLGAAPLRRPLIFVAFHWGDLHRGLRARVPEDVYVPDARVESVTPAEAGAIVRLADGTERRFDLVAFADGYHSAGRRALFPDTELDYRGYVCWRGVVDESAVPDGTDVATTFARFGTTGFPGSFIYPIPGRDGSIVVGKRLINWGLYVPTPEKELADFLVGRDGRHYDGTVPPGELRPDQERQLKAFARETMPPLYADIVNASTDTFAQAIYSVSVPAYRVGRICLMGDAAGVATPFTGSGIFKAANNAIHLRRALDLYEDTDEALGAWSETETAAAAEILDLGRQFEDAFIWNPPDFSTMSPDEAASWWQRSVHHPEGFTFEAAD